MALRIAQNLTFPLDVVTQTAAILAKRRAGKSYTMRRLCEQLICAKQQVVLVDPKGDQWGIRSAADGKAPGLPVIILGGERGDVPLEPQGGEIVAKLVVEDRVSAVLDLSLFRKHEVATFMTAFLENLYRLKAREQYRTPMMLVIDEADAIAPQKPQKGEERMLGAAEDIVRRGGQRGIGCILVTQRSAVLNKNVLTQAQILIALRTIAPQDLSAMKAWIDVHGTPEQCHQLMESLPSLPIGDAWVWSPGWPTVDGIFKRVHVLPIETFDSGATPKPGVKPVEPKQVADVDLEALRKQMSATIERAKADDPKALRAEIVTLKRELAKQKPEAETVVKEIPVLPESTLKLLDGFIAFFDDKVIKHLHVLGEIKKEVTETCAKFRGVPAMRIHAHGSTSVMTRHDVSQNSLTVSSNGKRSQSQQLILNALIWAEGIGLPYMDKTQLALMSDQSPTSGGYFNNLGKLRTEGLIEYPGAGSAMLTDAGRQQAKPVHIPTTSEELQAMLYAKLSSSQARILRCVIVNYPKALTKQEVALATGQSPTSGGYFNNLGRLRTLGLIEYPQPGTVKASQLLFLDGR